MPLTSPPCRELVIATTWDGQAAAADEEVRVGLASGGDGRGLRITVDAPFHDDPPPPGPPGPTPRLWEYEVVELFLVGGPDAHDYLEVEMSPHGHHWVLRLAGVRRPVEEGLEFDYSAKIDTGNRRWQGAARLPLDRLPPPPHRINAFAIHGTGESRRYLAWAPLPGTEPDFHQPRLFPRLDPPLRP